MGTAWQGEEGWCGLTGWAAGSARAGLAGLWPSWAGLTIFLL